MHKDSVKFRRPVPEICAQTDRQTVTLRSPTGLGGVIVLKVLSRDRVKTGVTERKDGRLDKNRNKAIIDNKIRPRYTTRDVQLTIFIINEKLLLYLQQLSLCS